MRPPGLQDLVRAEGILRKLRLLFQDLGSVARTGPDFNDDASLQGTYLFSNALPHHPSLTLHKWLLSTTGLSLSALFEKGL
jgi:hypothetical protein